MKMTTAHNLKLTTRQYDNLVGVYLDAAFWADGWTMGTSLDEMVDFSGWENTLTALDSIADDANAGLVALGLVGEVTRYQVAAHFWDARDGLDKLCDRIN